MKPKLNPFVLDEEPKILNIQDLLKKLKRIDLLKVFKNHKALSVPDFFQIIKSEINVSQSDLKKLQEHVNQHH